LEMRYLLLVVCFFVLFGCSGGGDPINPQIKVNEEVKILDYNSNEGLGDYNEQTYNRLTNQNYTNSNTSNIKLVIKPTARQIGNVTYYSKDLWATGLAEGTNLEFKATYTLDGKNKEISYTYDVVSAGKGNKYKYLSKSDLSFEDRMISHKPEMSSLYRKYSSDPNYDFIPTTFAGFGNFFLEDAKAQYNYMQENNIPFSELITDKTVKEKFGFTKEECNKYKNLYYVVKNDVSNSMQQDIFLALKYYELAEKITYTKLEIFKDATGYSNPEQYEVDHNVKDGKFKQYRPSTKTSGIGANAAIAKLQKIYDAMYPAQNKPSEYNLKQNFPNPFNPETNISYSLAKETTVKLTIYNMLGQQVATLVNGVQKAGLNTVYWNGRDSRGVIAGSGLYIYKLESPEFNSTKMMLMLK